MSGEALIIVDVQNDFIDGSLAVPHGVQVVDPINKIRNSKQWDAVVVTQDFHPVNHCSFASAYGGQYSAFQKTPEGQELWPDHCVANSWGAQLHKELEVKDSDIIVQKGTKEDTDSYSCFIDAKNNDSGLAETLRKKHIKKVVCVGLALDFCVYSSARDAKKSGFDVQVVLDGTRPVFADDGPNKIAQLKSLGIEVTQSFPA